MQYHDKTPAGEGRGSAGHVVDDTSRHAPDSSTCDPHIAAVIYADYDVEINAHTYLDRDGMPVFPVEPDGKRPLVRNGFKSATTDHTEISRWWRRWPNANVAIALPPGLLVVDVDLHKRPAQDTMDALESECGPLPPTRTVRTPSGGLHYYYRVPADSRFRGQAGPAVDLRVGGRHYVVAPPSRIGDRRYEWLEGEWDDPATLPLSWLARLEFARPEVTTKVISPEWLQRLTGLTVESIDLDDVGEFLLSLPPAPMSSRMSATLRGLPAAMRASAHETLISRTYSAISLGAEGHGGSGDAVGEILRAFIDENRRRVAVGDRSARDDRELSSEILRALAGAVIRIGSIS